MKKATTQESLSMALSRIVDGIPVNVPTTTRLSVSSVEKEAGLGNGSAYHYPDIVEMIKREVEKRTGRAAKTKAKAGDEGVLKDKLNEERKLKEKYKKEAELWRQKAESLAAQLHEMQAVKRAH